MLISSHKYLPSPTCFLHLYYHLLALSTLFFYMTVQVIYNNSQKDANLVTSFWQVLTHSTPLRYVPFATLQPLNSSNMSCLLPCYPHTRSPPYVPSPSFSCPSDPSVSHHPSNLSVGEGSWVSPISVATLFVRSFHWRALLDWKLLKTRDPCLDWLTRLLSTQQNASCFLALNKRLLIKWFHQTLPG